MTDQAVNSAAQFLAKTVLQNKYIPSNHKPHPQQAKFLVLPHREVLYGGAAGGGKSDALLMASLQFVSIQGYSALLLRRSYADLSKPGALIPRSKEWLTNTDARYNEQTHTWHFPGGGTLSFGYLQISRDIYQYQSAEYQFIGFDELTQFEENQYRYLFSRLRRLEGVRIPLRIRGATNPGGVGHLWVKRRFIDTDARVFIPSKLEDNPSLDRETYEQNLAELDPTTRRQLRHGDWSVRPPGDILKSEWFEVIPKGDVPPNLHPIRYWDLAATAVKPGRDPDYTAGALVSKGTDGFWYIHHIDYFREQPMTTRANVRKRASRDTVDTIIWVEQEPGASGKDAISSYQTDLLPEYTVKGHKKTGSKMSAWSVLASKAEAGLVKVVEGDYVDFFFDQCDSLQRDDTHDHDDLVDAVSGAFNRLGASGTLYASWMPSTDEDGEYDEPANEDEPSDFYMS